MGLHDIMPLTTFTQYFRLSWSSASSIIAIISSPFMSLFSRFNCRYLGLGMAISIRFVKATFNNLPLLTEHAQRCFVSWVFICAGFFTKKIPQNKVEYNTAFIVYVY